MQQFAPLPWTHLSGVKVKLESPKGGTDARYFSPEIT